MLKNRIRKEIIIEKKTIFYKTVEIKRKIKREINGSYFNKVEIMVKIKKQQQKKKTSSSEILKAKKNTKFRKMNKKQSNCFIKLRKGKNDKITITSIHIRKQ